MRSVRNRAAVLVTALAVAAVLSPVRASAVTGGTEDGDAHPYVGMLIQPGSTTPWCTVVLVRTHSGATIGLTDAHCLYRPGRHSGTGAAAAFTSAWTTSTRTYAARWYVDPAYDPATHLHDLAALVFTTAPPVAPARLAAPETTPAASIGTTVTTVGSGQPYPGERRAASEQVTSYDGSWLYLRPGSGNTCDGDSGGPDLIPATATVVALTNQGTCSYDQDTRLDTGAANAFADAAATWSRAAPRMTAWLSTARTHAGSYVTLTGRTSALYAGERILRQGYYSGAWHTWAASTVAPDGSYRFTIHPTVVTTDCYRIHLLGSATHPAGNTSSLRLQVTR